MDKHFFKFRLLGIGMFLAMIAVFSVAAMFLWNALMPGIFALPRLNYPQTLGLAALFRILLGGIGGWRFDRRGRGFDGPAGDARLFHHRNALREKWMNMSEEERKAFIEKEKDFLHFGRKFSRMHDFFDESARHEEAAPSEKGDGHE
jgi:hypothetical protein